MRILIRAAFMSLNLAYGIPQVANAAAYNAVAPTQESAAGWANG